MEGVEFLSFKLGLAFIESLLVSDINKTAEGEILPIGNDWWVIRAIEEANSVFNITEVKSIWSSHCF